MILRIPRAILALLLLACVAASALAPRVARADAPSAARPELRAARAKAPPVIDGRLDDPPWADAVAVTSFTQKIPESGLSPTERTTMRVLYDDDALYVAFECTQKAAAVARLARRDRNVGSDSVTVSIDSRNDGRSAFEFSVSAAGVLTDATRFDDMEYSTDWDDNWQAKVASTRSSWTVEMRIPFRVLRFDPNGTSWGFQARRYQASRQETDEWAFSPRNAGGEVSRYGRLVDLDLRSSRQGLELRPFVLGRVRHQDPDPTIGQSGFDMSGSAGGDLTWHPGRHLTLNATVNPDFAQVEADQLVLNLTNQELLLPEKRAFFLDGADLFATPLPLVYTRRIGRVPRSPSITSGEILDDRPTATPVVGAAKLTGTVGDSWTVSGLAALTGPSSVDVTSGGGSRYTFPLDPTTGFGALRVTRAIGSGLRLGATLTSVTRGEVGSAPTWLASPIPYPAALGAAAAGQQRCPDGTTTAIGARCTHDAYVGGLDWLWISDGSEYSVRGQAIATAIANGPDRTMLDGTVIRAGDVAPAARLSASKDGGEHWIGSLGLRAHGRKVDYDDLGFMPRQNELRGGLYVGYRTLEPSGPFLESETGLMLTGADNWDGLTLNRGAQLHTEVKWQSYWTSRVDAYVQSQYFDDREVGDGTALERDALVGFQQSVGTDARERLYARVQIAEEAVKGGAYNLRFDADVRWLPISTFELQVAPTATFASGEPRFAGYGADGTTPLFAPLTAESVGATVRVNYTFSPTLSLMAYAQLFLASERFRDFSAPLRRLPGGIVDLAGLAPAAPPPINPDLQQGLLDLSVILRWEYTFGSTLYLVYARSQAPQPPLAWGDEPRLDSLAVLRAPAADMLLLKLSYWLAL